MAPTQVTRQSEVGSASLVRLPLGGVSVVVNANASIPPRTPRAWRTVVLATQTPFTRTLPSAHLRDQCFSWPDHLFSLKRHFFMLLSFRLLRNGEISAGLRSYGPTCTGEFWLVP